MIDSFKPFVGINESNSNLMSINEFTDTINNDYMSEMFEFLMDINEECNSANKNFYFSLLKSDGDLELVHESYGDFFSKIKEIIDKFLKYLKTIFDKFITKLCAMIGSSRAIMKNKDKFDNFSDSDSFNITGFNYSFDSEIPAVHAIDNLNLPLLNNAKIPVKVENNKVSTDVAKKAIDDVYDKLLDKINEGYYDTFRAQVLGQNTLIHESDFTDECFKEYRSGASSPVKVTIDKAYITEAVDRMDHYKAVTDDIGMTKKKMEKEYKDIRVSIESMIDPNRSNIQDALKNVAVNGADGKTANVVLSADAFDSLNRYARALCGQVQEMCNIHGIAFASKLTATKEQYNQDKAVLNKALSEKLLRTSKLEVATEGVESEGNLWII